jgi:hypothetical protein
MADKPKKKEPTLREQLQAAWDKFQGKKPGLAQKAATTIKTRKQQIEEQLDEAG